MKAENKRQSGEGSRPRASLLITLSSLFNRGIAKAMLTIAFCIPLSAFCLPTLARAQGQTVDQIITIVNQDIITRSDLLWSLALDPNAPSPAENVSPETLRQKLDVMIDQRLIEQEARRVPGAPITAEEIAKKQKELIDQFKAESTFRQRVESVGLTPQKIDELIRERIYIERFVDFRFRSFVFVTEQEIKTYYDERLAPEIRKAGQVPPPLEATLPEGMTVREKINSRLKQEKINQEIDTWLNATRQRADIVHLAEP
jgi:hypothetical protein